MSPVNPSSFGRRTGAVRRYPDGTENSSIFLTLSRGIPKWRAAVRAHPVPARQADLAIKLHGVNPPALPVSGKGRQTGRVFLRRDGTVPPLRLA